MSYEPTNADIDAWAEDSMPYWQHQQHADETARQQAAMEALRKARAAGTPDDALMVLAYEAGVATDFYKEIRL